MLPSTSPSSRSEPANMERCRVRFEQTKLTNCLQDRPQRLLQKAHRDHCQSQAIIRQGHQRQGQGHHRGLNGQHSLRGNIIFSCFGASQGFLGKGLLFVCGLTSEQIQKLVEYNPELCSVSRARQKKRTKRGSLQQLIRALFLGEILSKRAFTSHQEGLTTGISKGLLLGHDKTEDIRHDWDRAKKAGN